VIVRHHYIPAVEDDVTMWRYMDVMKFLSLLQSQAIFFPSATVLSDPWEGSVSPINHVVRPTLYPDLTEEQRDHLNQALSRGIQEMRHQICISCWHESEHESSAMWNVYAPRGLGVAVMTTYRHIRDALHDCPLPIFGGRVKYYDPRTQGVPDHNVYLPYFYKRRSFEYERELRLIIDSEANLDKKPEFIGGLNIPVAVALLVKQVFLAPTTPDWAANAIGGAVRAFGYDFEVTRSTLDDPAMF
jgi:hypothetical protein